MTDDRADFEQTKARLEQIVSEANKKDTSLEKTIELLEEGVGLMSTCNDVIDQTWWRNDADEVEADGEEAAGSGDGAAAEDEAVEPDAPEAGGAAEDDAPEEDGGADGPDAGADEAPAEAPEDDERS